MKRTYPFLALFPAPFFYFYAEYWSIGWGVYPIYLVPVALLYAALCAYFARDQKVWQMVVWHFGGLGLTLLCARFLLPDDPKYFEPIGRSLMLIYTWLLFFIMELFGKHIIQYYKQNIQRKS
ncbi:hypothetical protein [Listeria ilorinensis]|uniref:hypothetical protein n=1 Tax=Listeria ilorinensis TaxID=2867439 RepID=UPI001EF4F191|nr:hypothetical protein [Listeria ilorinensis]